MKNKNEMCCLCGKQFKGKGHTPFPAKEVGLCCDECNYKVVVPMRIEQLVELR